MMDFCQSSQIDNIIDFKTDTEMLFLTTSK